MLGRPLPSASKPDDLKILGTPYYMAPEVLTKTYDKQCDMWSIGVILYLMLTGVPPFNAKDDAEILAKVATGKYSETTLKECGASEGAIDFITNLLLLEPQKRLSAERALQHPWIADYRSGEKRRGLEGTAELFKENLMNKNTRASKKLQEATIQILIKLLHPEELEDLEKAFRFFDVDGNGTISRQELLEGFRISQDHI